MFALHWQADYVVRHQERLKQSWTLTGHQVNGWQASSPASALLCVTWMAGCVIMRVVTFINPELHHDIHWPIAGFPLRFTFTRIQNTSQAQAVPSGLFTSQAPYGKLEGSILLGDSQRVPVSTVVTRTRGDGTCFVYGFAQGVRDAYADQQFLDQLKGNSMFSDGNKDSFLARLKFLAELPMSPGAPEWRKALSDFCFGNAASLVKHCGPQLSDQELRTVHHLRPGGAWSAEGRVRLVQQRAVLLLAPQTYFDEFYLLALHHLFNRMLDISIVREARQENGNQTFQLVPGTTITSNITGAAQVMMLHQEHSFRTVVEEGKFAESQRNHFDRLTFIGLAGPGSNKRFIALPNELTADGGPNTGMGPVPKAIQQTAIPESTIPPTSPRSNDTSPSCPPPPQSIVPPAIVDQPLQISSSPVKQSLSATAQRPIAEAGEEAIVQPQTIPAVSRSRTDTLPCNPVVPTCRAFQIVVSIPCDPVAGWQRCQKERNRLVDHLKKGTTNCIVVYSPGQGCTRIEAVCCFHKPRSRRSMQSNLLARYAKRWEDNIPKEIRRDPGDASVCVEPLTDHRLHHLCLQLNASSNPQEGTILVHHYDPSLVETLMATRTSPVRQTIVAGDTCMSTPPGAQPRPLWRNLGAGGGGQQSGLASAGGGCAQGASSAASSPSMQPPADHGGPSVPPPVTTPAATGNPHLHLHEHTILVRLSHYRVSSCVSTRNRC